MTRDATAKRFTVGARIAHRSVDREAGIVMTVLPQIVVRHAPDAIVTYMPSGSLTKRRTGDRSGGPRGRQLTRWDGGYEDRPWSGTSVLMLYRPGDAFSVWCAFGAEDQRPAWWYVNLEEPWRRTSIGFDSRDLWLDLWREPHGTEWHWKDEDELAWAVEEGRCTPERAGAIRREGERALAAIRRGDPPFHEDWEHWRPDPDWRTAEMPPGWRSEPTDPTEPA